MDTRTETGIVIIGAGQAAVQTAESLRALGHSGPITLLGDEAHGPYHRPPLSKAWLAGDMQAEQLAMRAPEALARRQITLRTGCKVTAIDRAAQWVQLANGERLAYSGLMLATGASPRELRVPGGTATGVHTLRSLDDARAIAEGLAACREQRRPLVVIGGGFIGLEVAATARKLGVDVTVIESAERLLGRVLAPVLSDWYAALHRGHGVELRLGTGVTALEPDAGGAVTGVRLSDGQVLPAGLVVVGIGVVPNDQLAQASGLACERGVVVDACGRTSDPRVVAAGDCTARRLPDGSLVRLESVHNATEQGKSAAAALLRQERPFQGTPWFWSDQYDKKLQIAGLSSGADRWAVRGDMASGSFSVDHFRQQRLLAVDSVNAAKEHLLARKLLDAGAMVTPAQVADAGADLSQVLAQPAGTSQG